MITNYRIQTISAITAKKKCTALGSSNESCCFSICDNMRDNMAGIILPNVLSFLESIGVIRRIFMSCIDVIESIVPTISIDDDGAHKHTHQLAVGVWRECIADWLWSADAIVPQQQCPSRKLHQSTNTRKEVKNIQSSFENFLNGDDNPRPDSVPSKHFV